MNYITVKKAAEDRFEEKKSVFIGYVKRVTTEEEAKEFITEINNKHKDARHNCYAYVIGQNMGIQRYSDNGEPQGTAGIPILEVIKKQGITDCAVVVTRYFGGILLGTGGLVRAYSETTQKAIENAQKIEMILGTEMEAKVEYSEYEKFKYYCQKNQIKIEKVEYNEKINCKIALENKVKNKIIKDYETKKINLEELNEINKKIIEKSIIK